MSRQPSLAAFEAFEATERGKALKYTTAWVGPEAAQDIVQEALLTVWKKWDTLTNPSGYLYGTCKKLAFGEYEDRSRGPLLLAELPEQLRLDSKDEEDSGELAPVLTLVTDLLAENSFSWQTPLVGGHLALGKTRAEISDMLDLPLSEVHRSARELRRYYNARRDNPELTSEENPYTPHGLVMRAMRGLSRREQQVMALAALGLKPQLIAPLIGITRGSARTTLCHARKSVAEVVGLSVDEGAPDVVDHFIRSTLDATELLHMLPYTPWKAEALIWAGIADGRIAAGFSSLSPLNKLHEHYRDDPGQTVKITAQYRGFGHTGRYGPRGLVPYLIQVSRLIAIVREAMEARQPAAAYGSVRWTHPGLRYRPFDRNLRMRSATYRRMQPTYAPNLESDAIPAGYKKAAASTSAYFCPVPSWPAKPPQYLVPALAPDMDSGPWRSFASWLRMSETTKRLGLSALDRLDQVKLKLAA